MSEHSVECGICHGSFRPIPSQIKLICNECSGENKVIREILVLLKWIRKHSICIETLTKINPEIKKLESRLG